MINFLRNLIWHDFWLKFFSLVLAVLIYFVIWFAKNGSPATHSARGSDQRVYVNIPVSVRLMANDIRGLHVVPGEVEVTVQGDKKVLNDLQLWEIRAEVDLSGLDSVRGAHKKIDVITPRGTACVRVFPEQVEVTEAGK